jgi:hypothetical protein
MPTVTVSVGTLAWARSGLGRLSARDRVELFGQAIVFQARTIGSFFARRGRVRVDPDSIRPPDSALAKQAVALCAGVSPPSLLEHSQRAYVWARMLAAAADLRFDDELLFVACLAHDLGLTDAYRGCARHAECFTLDSAEAAVAFARSMGWDNDRQDALAEAIVLHLNVVVPLRRGTEAHLLHEGTALDVLGIRAWEIARDRRDRIVERHPRHNFKADIDAIFTREKRERPLGRVCLLCRYLFFRPLLRFAPFAE